ncbi:hypothetical protein COLO4_31377 [Corchorus olitorius]|uniref:Uncharacterized protein n=1 Tax=Corchorus olitorius TaxID=93759 RepID=A0A1R3H4H8_9ROSI|nr:hypothetical protein COLO4_31377 [Corchorus olitorius]
MKAFQDQPGYRPVPQRIRADATAVDNRRGLPRCRTKTKIRKVPPWYGPRGSLLVPLKGAGKYVFLAPVYKVKRLSFDVNLIFSWWDDVIYHPGFMLGGSNSVFTSLHSFSLLVVSRMAMDAETANRLLAISAELQQLEAELFGRQRVLNLLQNSVRTTLNSEIKEARIRAARGRVEEVEGRLQALRTEQQDLVTLNGAPLPSFRFWVVTSSLTSFFLIPPIPIVHNGSGSCLVQSVRIERGEFRSSHLTRSKKKIPSAKEDRSPAIDHRFHFRLRANLGKSSRAPTVLLKPAVILRLFSLDANLAPNFETPRLTTGCSLKLKKNGIWILISFTLSLLHSFLSLSPLVPLTYSIVIAAAGLLTTISVAADSIKSVAADSSISLDSSSKEKPSTYFRIDIRISPEGHEEVTEVEELAHLEAVSRQSYQLTEGHGLSQTWEGNIGNRPLSTKKQLALQRVKVGTLETSTQGRTKDLVLLVGLSIRFEAISVPRKKLCPESYNKRKGKGGSELIYWQKSGSRTGTSSFPHGQIPFLSFNYSKAFRLVILLLAILATDVEIAKSVHSLPLILIQRPKSLKQKQLSIPVKGDEAWERSPNGEGKLYGRKEEKRLSFEDRHLPRMWILPTGFDRSRVVLVIRLASSSSTALVHSSTSPSRVSSLRLALIGLVILNEILSISPAWHHLANLQVQAEGPFHRGHCKAQYPNNKAVKSGAYRTTKKVGLSPLWSVFQEPTNLSGEIELVSIASKAIEEYPDSVKSIPETRLGNRKETSSSSGSGTLSLLTAPLDSEQLSSSDYGKTLIVRQDKMYQPGKRRREACGNPMSVNKQLIAAIHGEVDQYESGPWLLFCRSLQLCLASIHPIQTIRTQSFLFLSFFSYIGIHSANGIMVLRRGFHFTDKTPIVPDYLPCKPDPSLSAMFRRKVGHQQQQNICITTLRAHNICNTSAGETGTNNNGTHLFNERKSQAPISSNTRKTTQLNGLERPKQGNGASLPSLT